MTQDSPSQPEDARALQLKLYREIGISAVAAALRSTARPEPAPHAVRAVDVGAEAPQVTRKRAA